MQPTRISDTSVFWLLEVSSGKSQENSENISLHVPPTRAIDENEPTEEDVYEDLELIIGRMDEALNEREQFIIRQRFGLDRSGKGQSLRAIGDALGISKEQARQMFLCGIEKLRVIANPFESVFMNQ